jgi:5-oxopent-3-ene-1,2,5-tricarboxylate decarboxylase / 2-hydroxyhepta-2,4-diene-1,7-dioate isomerase
LTARGLPASVLAAAFEQEREEEFVAGRVAAGEQIEGLYPLGERWRPAYEAWLAERKP